MKWLLRIVGVLMVLVGGLWVLQGTNIVPVGFMAGQMQYTIMGAVIVLAGIGVIVLANRRSRKVATKSDSPTRLI